MRFGSKETRFILCAAVVLAIAVLVTAYATSRWESASRRVCQPLLPLGDWVQPHDHAAWSAYFRIEFRVSSPVKNAWVVVSARDAFELSVNGNTQGRFYLWRPTRPFQNGLSEKGQRVSSRLPSMALNYPREYQWDGHDSYRAPVYLSLTNAFALGENVVTLDVETRRAPAKACWWGEIELWDGRVFPLRSDATWRAEPTPPGVQHQRWSDVGYDASQWAYALPSAAPQDKLFRTVVEEPFTQPFTGEWLRHPSANGAQAVWFERQWQLAERPDEAFIRLLSNRSFGLFINDQRVEVAAGESLVDSGGWVLNQRRGLKLDALPELLDPDEVGEFFAGDRYMHQRHGDPKLDPFVSLENVLNKTRDKARLTTRSDLPGTYDPKRSMPETRRAPTHGPAHPEKRTPVTLANPSQEGGYCAYDVTALLHAGPNRIAIRLAPPSSADGQMNWSPQLAIDGIANSGTLSESLPTRAGWKTSQQTQQGEHLSVEPAASLGPALTRGHRLPRLDYRGEAVLPKSERAWWQSTLPSVAACAVFAFAVIAIACRVCLGARSVKALTAMLIATCGSFSSVLLGALLVEASWAERHEMLWFRSGVAWQIVFASAAGVAILSWLLTAALVSFRSSREAAKRLLSCINSNKPNWAWWLAITWVCLLAFFLRAYKLDYQPLDDDEYASTQAILAIAETGVPQYAPEDVWYTRSPFFHYVMGGIAYVFGSDLLVLRGVQALLGAATCWMTYLYGATLLKSRTVGLVAAFLLAIHPFQVFTGHVVRFYQMQQFFALVAVYCAVRGFVTDQKQSWRIATIFAFLLAVLSQEISAVMAFPLLLVYLLFARGLGWGRDIELLCYAGVAIALIGLDYAVFRTRCLTRTEGVSANMEAAVKPHFWYVYNLFSLFIGYSRLHVIPSLVLAVATPLMLSARRNRAPLATLVFLFSGVLFTNLLVTHVSLRYQYWLIPLWLLAATHGAKVIGLWLASILEDSARREARIVMPAIGVCGLVVLTVLSYSPWRIARSYEVKILGDSTGAMRFVAENRRPDDKLVATEPHTHAGLIEAGGVDYDLSIPLLYDFAVLDDGKLIDRNAGATVVASTEQLQRVCEQNDRVWIVLNREKFRSRGQNLRWEYPGARAELFIRSNCELKHRTYLWSVYLWDANRGYRDPFRNGSI